MGVVFFAAHVRTLPRTLEDLDSINFALGVEEFDVQRHRPHPPGYPVFIALAKASTAGLRAIAPHADRDRVAADGLALWGLVAGTLAPLVLAEFWLAVGLSASLAVLAALLGVASPLFWFTAARPLTDTPGLVVAVAVQTLLVRGLRRVRSDPAALLPAEWLWGGLGAGLIIGVRSQTMWLTGPLLAWCAGELVVRGNVKSAALLAGAAALGVLLWAVPMVWLSGGPAKYFAVLGSQGTADFQGVEMLATTPTWRLLRSTLVRTFVWPWAVPAVANAVLLVAVAGLVRLGLRGRRVLATLLLSFCFYLVFHLMFQETLTVRYALPIMIPVAGLTVVGLSMLGVRTAATLTAALIVGSVVITQPRLEAYSAKGDPFFRGFRQMLDALPGQAEAPALRMHHQVWWAIQRVMEWYHPYWDVGPQPHPGDREWLGLVRAWQNGSTRSVWYLTDVRRSDVALFDPRSRRFHGRFEIDPPVRALITPGVASRLDRYNWWELRRPGWMLGTGWALTPEVAGVTAADSTGPHQRPAEAFLRRPEQTPGTVRGIRVLVGGRYLAGPGHPAAVVSAFLDGRSVSQWRVSGNPISFAQWIELPDGLPPAAAPYSALTVQASSDQPAQAAPMIGLEQFDAAPFDEPIAAFVDGWQEPEGDRETGELWRWTSGRSVLEVRGGAGELTLRLSGASPLKYFDRPPDVVVRAGTAELGRFRPSGDFSEQIELPAAALASAAGRVTIETNLTFRPVDRGGSADQRTLGLRLTRVEVSRRTGR